MESRPERRFWQIHLSTAIVLMFVASALMWMNLTPTVYRSGFNVQSVASGWPLPCHTRYINAGEEDGVRLDGAFAAFDAVFAMLQIVLVAVIAEAITRRKESDKARHAFRRRVALYSSIILTCEIWFISNLYAMGWSSQFNPAGAFVCLADIAALILLLLAAAYSCHHFLRHPDLAEASK